MASSTTSSSLLNESYDLVSLMSGSTSDEAVVTSDDEVVWLPQGSSSESSYESSLTSDTDDGDFVVLGRPRLALRKITRATLEGSTGNKDELSSALAGLSLFSHRPTARDIEIVHPSSTASKASVPKASQSSLASAASSSPKKKRAKKAAKAARAASSIFPVVGSDTNSEATMVGYEDAYNFITSFLSNPESKDSVCKLTLLKSLIIELGLTAASSSTLPGSVTAAKALLKSQAHINIKEYIAVRAQGQAALRRVMHPSRNALVRDIRKTGNRASLKWVKSQGLQVLLVHCFH